jgi:anti-sigma factor RsiW
MKWIWHRCRRRQDTSLLAAGGLGEEEKIELERHLAECEECRNYLVELKTLTAPLAGWEKNLSALEATSAARMRWAKAVQDSGGPAPSGQPWVQNLWRIVWDELIWPNRRAWAGMAALWVAMLALNLSWSEHRGEAGTSAGSSQEMMLAWAERNLVLAELARPSFVVDAAPANLPRPHSQMKRSWEIL